MKKFRIKTVNKELIQVEGELLAKPTPPKPSVWFRHFEKRIDRRFDKQEEFNKQQKQFNNKIIKKFDNLENRFDNIVVKNNLKE